MIYLASPYTHADPFVRELRYLAAAKAVLKLMAAEEPVFSPILHNHQLARIGRLPHSFDFWADLDSDMLRRCDKLVVLKLEGWNISTGVAAEVKLALSLNLPVEYMNEC